MCTNLGVSVLLSFCIQSLEWKGDILSQKLSIYGRQFGYREEQNSLLRGWGRKSHHLKRWIFENANCYSHYRLIYQHSVPGWNWSVGIGLLKGNKNKWGFCFWYDTAQLSGTTGCVLPWQGQQEMLLNTDLEPVAVRSEMSVWHKEKMCGISLGFLVQELKELWRTDLFSIKPHREFEF